MRQLAAIVAMGLLALSSCAATLTLRATAPTADNDGTCTVPILYAAPTGVTRVMHFSWSGPVSGEDSVVAVAGTTATLTVNVRPGVYSIHGWATGAGGVGCDTVITRTVTAPPGRISFQ